MAVIIFIVVFFLLILIIYLLFKKNVSENKIIKSYYHRRFLRNKLQMERYLDELNLLITTNNCGDIMYNNEITLNQYLINLKTEYKKNYVDFNLKALKRNNLKEKHKKFYSKMLIKQSEKLYFVESELLKLNEIYNV